MEDAGFLVVMALNRIAYQMILNYNITVICDELNKVKGLIKLVKTYAGRYQNGNFIIPEAAKANIPNNVRIIITVIDENVLNLETTFVDSEHVAAEKFLNAMENLRLYGFSKEDNEAIDALQRGEYKLTYDINLLI